MRPRPNRTTADRVRKSASPRGREGFSLLEVILSLGILVGGVLAAHRLVGFGLEAADLARAQSLAVLLAESRLAELQTGTGLGSESSGEFADHPGFRYEVQSDSTNVSGLKSVQVKITYTCQGQDFDYVLTRWIYSPEEVGGTRW